MDQLHSLRFRLPLLISALLFAVIGGFSWFANEHIHDVEEAAAARGLSDATNRFGALLSISVADARQQLARLADSEVLRAVLDGSPSGVRGARGVLSNAAVGGRRFVWRALYREDCTTAAAVGAIRHAPPCRRGDTSGVSAFQVRGDTVAYLISVPVRSTSGDILGMLRESRVVNGAAAGTIASIIGDGAVVMLGSADGAWTDLQRPVATPPSTPRIGTAYRDRDVAGTRQLAFASAVAGTPWLLVAKVPLDPIMERASELMAGILIAALLALAVGVFGAYRIGRRVVAPLAELEAAAAAIARGQYELRVREQRRDEVGKLANAFNRMAAQVETATADLEAQALELEEQMEALRDAQRDSEAARTLLDDVMTTAPIGVAVLDRDLRYLRVNPGMASLTGRRPDELMGRVMGSVEPSLRSQLVPIVQEALSSGTIISNRRLTLSLVSGATRHWLVSVFPVQRAGGGIDGAGLLLLDMSSHQELEERFLQAQKMEAVGRLAGGVAHDFNNLLTVILSYCSLTLEDCEPESEVAGNVAEIRGAGERAASLTRQLLAFSRNQVLQPRVLSVNDVAADMQRMLQRLIGEDITLVLDLAEDLPYISADAGQLEQVIMNLVVNARDAMPNGGRISVETSTVWVSSELSAECGASAGQYVRLVVADTGEGMSWEVQRHLFEPFFTTKVAGRGTGLGLATVYGVVKQSGGDIHVSSSPGKGARFTLYFPAAAEGEVQVREAPHADAPLGGSETVLLVDDDQAVQTLGSRVLRRAGYRVLDARTPAEALQIARTYDGDIDLLLTDVVLPVMNGAVVAELVSELRPGLGTLFMSGYTSDEVLRRGVSGDPDRFVQKPFTPRELMQKVRAALDERKSSRRPTLTAAGD